ncbi:MAG: AAA family ATPase [Verrucomicrobia subdivision 3 bacterium]|nr:AAA family ATPase [Limisphaerales bacterium]
MRIARLTLKNFRSFGAEAITVDFDALTGLIGANGAGKSAVLLALARLFGISQTDRRLRQEDFHIPHNSDPGEIASVELMIEARLEFPELFGAEEGTSIPACFNHMVLGEQDSLFCRVRLEGAWTRSNLAEGDIDEKAYWITTDADEVKDEHKRPMQAYERSMIHVLYVPAFRDASKQLTQASGSLVYRVLHAIEWSDMVKQSVEQSAQAIRDSMQGEQSIQHLHQSLGKAWRKLQDLPAFRNVAFQPVGGALDELLKRVEVVFSPGAAGREYSIDWLSEGLKSLFYFSLVASVFQIEEAVKGRQLATANAVAGEQGEELSGDADPLDAFSAERLRPPALTVFAVEEPENHLAPHYLGRIIELLQGIASSGSGQVVLTSHSPAIMSRLDPEHVRYLRLDAGTLETRVRKIVLPAAADEAFKYVKEAVRAYPELYFARLVVLGEGDSEEIVIPHAARASGVAIDTNLISVVPLGGRHVNHLWKLLHGLDIPHLTLLDLDRERVGGGWSRIHYACSELIKVGVPREKVLSIGDGKGGTKIMADDEFAKMPGLTDHKTIPGWANMLETHGVFFSAPLDLDFLMLRAFPTQYQAAGGGSPRIPNEQAKLAERVRQATAVVLKEDGGDGSTYSEDEKQAFIWYSYLFLGKGKPTTHLLALNRLKPAELVKGMPPVLARLIKAIQAHLPAQNEPIA